MSSLNNLMLMSLVLLLELVRYYQFKSELPKFENLPYR